MPTAAKLIAALVLAIFGYFVADNIKPLLPEGTPTNWLYQVSMFVPIICGWRIMGRLVGKGYRLSFNAALYATVASAFFVVLTFAIAEMLKRSTRLQYDGPMEAVVNMFGILVEYSLLLINPGPAMYLAICAIILGPLAEFGHRKWG